MNKSEKLDERLEDDTSNKIDELRLDYAWNWFDFHAKQRMQLFNFFLIITGILASAYIGAYEKGTPLMRFAVSLIGTLQAFSFFVFDIRSRNLTSYAEDILEKMERDKLFPDNFTHPDVNKGNTLGLTRRDSDTKMREGQSRERTLDNVLKMKYWIRGIEIIVGLVFFVGLAHALIYSNPQNSTVTNQAGATSTAPKQDDININSSTSPTPGAK